MFPRFGVLFTVLAVAMIIFPKYSKIHVQVSCVVSSSNDVYPAPREDQVSGYVISTPNSVADRPDRGEEYELVFTVKPGWGSFLKQLFEGRGLRTYFIGRAVEKPGVWVKAGGFEGVLERRG
jgi:thiamine monophosphate kinase